VRSTAAAASPQLELPAQCEARSRSRGSADLRRRGSDLANIQQTGQLSASCLEAKAKAVSQDHGYPVPHRQALQDPRVCQGRPLRLRPAAGLGKSPAQVAQTRGDGGATPDQGSQPAARVLREMEAGYPALVPSTPVGCSRSLLWARTTSPDEGAALFAARGNYPAVCSLERPRHRWVWRGLQGRDPSRAPRLCQLCESPTCLPCPYFRRLR